MEQKQQKKKYHTHIYTKNSYNTDSFQLGPTPVGPQVVYKKKIKPEGVPAKLLIKIPHKITPVNLTQSNLCFHLTEAFVRFELVCTRKQKFGSNDRITCTIVLLVQQIQHIIPQKQQGVGVSCCVCVVNKANTRCRLSGSIFILIV
eukprot:TRINITY_DN4227_c1_g2_i1.p4 TRINITY_DN4227_c1_g2~~TRINITY_DN4227_c1_g2_i1.p4  ORF type:complete len:146 (+),score=4.26 TRINITY_DN4227_c1_g2_i1:443-880(+)